MLEDGISVTVSWFVVLKAVALKMRDFWGYTAGHVLKMHKSINNEDGLAFK